MPWVRGYTQLTMPNINSEIGILFHDPEIAGNASRHFDEHIDKVAFREELVSDKNGSESLIWTGTENGNKIVFKHEPYAGFWKRLSVNLMRVLPVDSML